MSDDRIEKLWGHLENMSPDQVRDHVRKIRTDRRVKKLSKTVKKAVTAKKEASTDKAKKALDALSPEAIERLLKGM